MSRTRMVAPPATLLSYLTRMNFIGECLCAQILLYPLIYFNDIWYTYIPGQDGVPRARMVAPLAVLLSYLPCTSVIGESLCAQ